MSSTLSPPRAREQLCNRYYSNKHTHQPPTQPTQPTTSEKEEEEEEEDLFVFNDHTIEGPRAPAVKPPDAYVSIRVTTAHHFWHKVEKSLEGESWYIA